MNRSKHLLIASAAATLLTSASVAQQFVTYDPAVPNLELAANNCPPAPSRPRARDLHNRGAAPAPISGAVAADSRGELLYTATGFAADGIPSSSGVAIDPETGDIWFSEFRRKRIGHLYRID